MTASADYPRILRDCPACGESTAAHVRDVMDHFSGETYPVVRCTRCALLYLSEAPSERDIHRHYENFAGANMHAPPNALFRMLREVAFAREYGGLIKQIGANRTVVELGTGDGSLARYLVGRGCRVAACDVFPASQWAHADIPYHAADLNNMSPDVLAGRDAVLMRHVLEHVHHPARLIDDFRKSGVAYVHLLVPNAASPFVELFGNDWCSWDPPRHLQFFEPHTLDRLLDAHGYRLESVTDHGIDELVVSLFRRRMNEWQRTKSPAEHSPEQAWWFRLLQPKGVLCTVSAALSSPFVSSVLSRLYVRR